eukprot:TRINITY_DN8192_c0_g1_i1.p1 TRINITY_DN8192_c0_g1~~TRINITY_DN8192_c0_g1_i1.p1  ORF type:complete len:206 (-),score=18.86 TRINITY_DN8192_c0_g1_i1:579-1196(-)
MKKLVLILYLLSQILCRDTFKIPSEHFIDSVPWYKQVTVWSCGAASLQMVLNYWDKENAVDQRAIIDVCRTSEDLGTFSWDLVRGGHFSVVSSSNQKCWFPEYAYEIGYPGRPMGLISVWNFGNSWTSELKAFIARDYPVIILQAYALSDFEGHYRVVVGYNDSSQEMILYDPWGRDNQPEKLSMSYVEFEKCVFMISFHTLIVL